VVQGFHQGRAAGRRIVRADRLGKKALFRHRRGNRDTIEVVNGLDQVFELAGNDGVLAQHLGPGPAHFVFRDGAATGET